jgi:hypothetical protein
MQPGAAADNNIQRLGGLLCLVQLNPYGIDQPGLIRRQQRHDADEPKATLLTSGSSSAKRYELNTATRKAMMAWMFWSL